MSRASTSSQRSLTLTEELEKLEQSITLTLQEIDHNFSRAHRIVTTSILPVVEQYAEHSKNVWEGSKFWKQFFEASANVSLSGYEEVPPEEETVTEDLTSTTEPSSSTYPSPAAASLSTSTPNAYRSHPHDSPSIFSSPATQSTPRAPHAPTAATYSSPYETLRREVVGARPPSPSTPSTPSNQPPTSTNPLSSPFIPPSTTRAPARTPANDPLLHRVLDKNYRVLATPHAHSHLPIRSTPTPKSARTQPSHASAADLDSSPMAPPPTVRAEIFDSPARGKRVPGVSVLTPARRGNPSWKGKEEIGWESDSDDEGLPAGMSPPKTMQFYVPQSRLLKTPAREASKRIVEGLLMTAGGDVTGSLGEEDSPSVVGRGALLAEDTF
ncbi:DASH complex subunit ask1 [Lambiella insularis]|nr:DASH complex subunit ask1 [Lambiella insularis]